VSVRSVVVLGSTGSIGRQTLEVLAGLSGEFLVRALTCGSNWELLVEQAGRFRPERVAAAHPECAEKVARELSGTGIEVAAGPAGVAEVAATPADVTVAAIVGSAGVSPTLAAAGAAKVLALANKEALVGAGRLVLERARQAGTTLLPVDSEHSAVFQALLAGRREEVRRIILTASGGPFGELSLEELARVTPEAALSHPTWEMGAKITIDSATLMNKAFEVVEAHWLFGLGVDEIDVVVHPESIVHALVEFCDGSVVAGMGLPDMRLPIQYALTWPERKPTRLKPLVLEEVGSLHFRAPELDRFPALGLGWEIIERAGTAGAVAVRANEVAREAFLQGRLAFPHVYQVIRRALDAHEERPVTDLTTLEAAETWAGELAHEVVASLSR